GVVRPRPVSSNRFPGGVPGEGRPAAERCADESVRAVVVTGNGRAFCAGGDLGAFADTSDPRALLKSITVELHAAQVAFATLDAPVLAAVNGTAAGAGMSLACSCDLVLAADSAKFTMAYTGAGLAADGGSTFYLPRLIGLRRTQELIFTNRVLAADEALEWQLVNRVVAADALQAESMALAAQLAAGPTRAFGAVKRTLLASAARDLAAQLDLEGDEISEMSATRDGQEGIHAFLEKRKPSFVGE
ncbi:MAG: enoyl-CoA hydratase-related protein, partial [Myxococcota bacterium]|nr:enoyl-CoA hydratase-related protein [Myxococcota bacterium]